MGHEHDHGPGEMRPVDEVRAAILDDIHPLAPIELPLQEAFGCVLASNMVAEGALPPFSSSAMDGFAVQASDVAGATEDVPTTLRIIGRVRIGRAPEVAIGPGTAVHIATGAPVPSGADAIVPVERTLVEGGAVHVLRPSQPGQHIRLGGEDVQVGQVLVPAGRRLGAPELGLLAASGRAILPVYPRPRVMVLATGDELVEPGRPVTFGQIPDANSYTLFAGLREAGATPHLGGIVRDEVDLLRDEILGLTTRADCFISSGGVSVGERDVVKKAFERWGEVDVYRVAMQPGMPQAYGRIEGIPYFGLPGNPVSVFVSFEVFIRPAMLRLMGRKDIYRPEVTAVLDTEISGPRDRLQFARVRVRREGGEWRAASVGGAGSNLLATVAKANGLAQIPIGTPSAPAGSKVKVMVFRALEDD